MRLYTETATSVHVNECDYCKMEIVGDYVQLETSGMIWHCKADNPQALLSEFRHAVKEHGGFSITEFVSGKAPINKGEELGTPLEGVDILTQAQRAVAWCTRLSVDQLIKLFVDWGTDPALLINGELTAVMNLGEAIILRIINSIKTPKYSQAQEHPDWEFLRDFLKVYKTADKNSLNPGYKIVWEAVENLDYGSLLDLGADFLEAAKQSITSNKPTRLEGIL